MAKEDLSQEEVKHIARLARLKLTPEEESRFVLELNEVLTMVDVLDQVDVKDLPETAQVSGLVNAVRPDQTGATLTLEEALLNAPKSDGRHFNVPNVL